MKTRSILLLTASITIALASNVSGQSGPKSAADILKVWDKPSKPLTRTARALRSTTAPATVIENYQRIATATTRGGKDNTRGIEVVPTNNQQVEVSVEVEPGSAVSFDNILFKIDTAEFYDEASSKQVAIIAEAMKTKAEVAFLIEGHTCDLGSDEHNKPLSEQRAAKVVAELKRLGVSPERLLPLGYGESEPASANTSDEGRQKNRRVTIYKRA